MLVPEFTSADQASAPVEIASWRYVQDSDLDAAIDAPSPSLRDTYRLFAAGHCYAAIGSRLAIPVRTVGVRMHRGRSRLRAALRPKVDRARTAA